MPAEAIVVSVDSDLEDLIPVFLEQRRRDLLTIAEALPRKDFEALRRIGHGMAGGGQSYGFGVITEIGDALVLAARAGNDAEISRLAAQLTDYLARVRIKYVKSI